MILTKKYKIVHDNKKNIIIKNDEDVKVYVGSEKIGAEFDSKEDMEKYINDNNLIRRDDDNV